MNISFTRVSKELVEIQKSSSKDGLFLEAIGGDLSKLRGQFNGPPGTPYEGGKFSLRISICEKYPFVPPTVVFETKIWHPNISSVTGVICLDILKDQWAAAMSLRTVMISLQALLCNPEPKDPQDAIVAKQLIKEPSVFSNIARQWTRIYASGLGKAGENEEFMKKLDTLVEMGVNKEQVINIISNNGLSLEKALENYFS